MQSKDMIVWAMQAFFGLLMLFGGFMAKRIWFELDLRRTQQGQIFERMNSLQVDLASLKADTSGAREKYETLREDIKEFKTEFTTLVEKLSDKLDRLADRQPQA